MGHNITSDTELVNALSIVTLLELGTERILLMGDANKHTESFLLDNFRNELQGLALIQMPHHGSITAQMSPAFTQHTRAAVAYCSTAHENVAHSLPRWECLMQFSEGTELLGDDDPENFVHCYLPKATKNAARKKRKLDDGVENNPLPQYPEGFVRTWEGNAKKRFGRGTVWGRYNFRNNIQATGSMPDLRTEQEKNTHPNFFGSDGWFGFDLDVMQ